VLFAEKHAGDGENVIEDDAREDACVVLEGGAVCAPEKGSVGHGVPAEGAGDGGEEEADGEAGAEVWGSGEVMDAELRERDHERHEEPDDGGCGPVGLGAAKLLRDGAEQAGGEDREDGFDQESVQGFVAAGFEVREPEGGGPEEGAEGGGFPTPRSPEGGARMGEELADGAAELFARCARIVRLKHLQYGIPENDSLIHT